MPGRWTAAAILLLWAAAVAWQISRGVSAPYTTAPRLIDSLRAAAGEGETVWTISHNNVRLGKSVNEVREDRSIGYIIRQNVTLDGDLRAFLNLAFVNRFLPTELGENLALTLNSDIQVTQFGSLARFSMSAAVHLDKRRQDGTIKAFITGRTEENQLLLAGYVTVMEHKSSLPADTKVRHDSKNVFMSSLAPADCLPGIRGGQTWEAPVIDLKGLMTDQAMGAATGGELSMPARKPSVVRVRDEPVWWGWSGVNTACWLVESKQRGLTIQLWVRQADGQVLRQQARWGDTAIDLIREPKKPKAEAAKGGRA